MGFLKVLMVAWTIAYEYIDTTLFLLSRMPSFIVRLLIIETQKICNKEEEEEDGKGKRWPNALKDILLFHISNLPSYILWLLITATEKISSSTMPLAWPTQKTSNEKDEDDDDDDGDGDEESWSNAHQDILLLIKSKLNFLDQLNFGVVCGAWNSVPDATTSCIDKLPWIFGFQNEPYGGFRVSGLYDPYTEKTYRIDHQLLKPRGDKEFAVQFVPGSKCGWVFLSVMLCDTDECKSILCNAFTMETIHLPDLKIKGGFSRCTMIKGTFSTIPSSSDCVFYFAIHHDEIIVLFTCSYGDETWSSIKLSTRPEMLYIQEMMYMNKILYFSSQYGKIWAFDTVHQDWDHIPLDCSEIRTYGECYYAYQLVEYDSEMLLVGYCIGPPRTYRIYKIDWSRKAWVEQVTGFSNVAIFIDDGCDSSHAVSFTSDYGDEKIKSLGRRIYPYREYHGHARDFFYLYMTGCDDDDGDEKCGYCTLLPDSTDFMIWVKPPL